MNHDTPLSLKDPRITAYALGELPETEKKELENLFLQHPELQSELDEIRKIGTLLTEALEHEPILETESIPLPTRKNRTFLPKITVAATLLLVLGGGIFFLTHPSGKERQLSKVVVAPSSCADSNHMDGETTSSNKIELNAIDSNMPDSNMLDFDALDVEVAEETTEMIKEENHSSPDEKRTVLPEAKSAKKRAERSIQLQDTTAPAGRRLPGDADSILNKGKEKVSPFSAPAMDASEMDILAAVPMEESSELELHFSRARSENETLPNNQNSYAPLEENRFQNPAEVPFSTFGMDVDTASYTLARQYLTEQEQLPPPEAIRVEEFIQYFNYDFPQPPLEEKCPIATHLEIHPHPWQEGVLMAQVSLQAREIPKEKRPPLNLVFLLDVSGSMSDWNKLPLVKDGMMELLDQLTEGDRIAIVTYANDAQIHLPATSGLERKTLEKAILQLNASGGTAGSRGLEMAYEIARNNFDKEAANRVILCSDGDFNIGMTDNDELEKQIAREAQSGIFLTVLGFGMGNYHDDRLKILASKGNGNYGYVDSRSEAKRLLCDDFCGTLLTIAKDVKLQIEFNPQHVAAYRLIGFEHRQLNDRDFHDDRKDAGDMGAGHHVTALYELVPHNVPIPSHGKVDTPRYASVEKEGTTEVKPDESLKISPEWMFVKLRYKLPQEKESSLVEIPFTYHAESKTEPGRNFRLATSAALFGLLLRQSEYTADANWDTVRKLLNDVVPKDAKEQELENLVKIVQELDSSGE